MGVRSSQPKSPNLNKTDGHLLEYYRNTFVAGGGGTNSTVPSPLTATGGVISDYTVSGTTYRAHIFTSSGVFEVTELGAGGSNTIDYVMVAGGGGSDGGSARSERSASHRSA